MLKELLLGDLGHWKMMHLEAGMQEGLGRPECLRSCFTGPLALRKWSLWRPGCSRSWEARMHKELLHGALGLRVQDARGRWEARISEELLHGALGP